MYSLDINFLSDREIRPVAAGPSTAAAGAKGDQRPLFLGLAVAIAALAAVGGYWVLLRQQIQELTAQSAALDSELGALQTQVADLQAIEQQVQLVRAESQAFARAFDRILPWSAVLQEIRALTPTGIRLKTITQQTPTQEELQAEATAAAEAAAAAGLAPPPADPAAAPPADPAAAPPAEGAAPPAEGAAPPAEGAAPPVDPAAAAPVTPPAPVERPLSRLVVEGEACSFSDINDFLLLLRQSPFLVSEKVVLLEGTRQEATEFQVPAEDGVCPGRPANEQYYLINFRMQAEITRTPASELVEVLDSRGAVGLTSRIRALRNAGIINPTP